MLISYYLPSNNLTNDTLETLYAAPSWTASKIYRKTGIKSRPIAGTELVSDMAVKAAQNLFDEYNISPQDIDFVLLCTQSPDYFLPTTACLVQERLGIPTTSGAFDYNLGCSGYIYGLATAKGLLCAGIAKISCSSPPRHTPNISIRWTGAREQYSETRQRPHISP